MRKVLATLAVVLMTGPAFAQEKDIVDIAASSGQFKTLVAAIQAAGLVDTLKSEGPFTVFAPTDEAFARLPKGTVESLLKPENKAKLVDLLTYHVVSGKVPASEAVKLDGKKATSVQGSGIPIKVSEGSVCVGTQEAKVIKADIMASNGVIHVIDQVIMPPSE